MLGRGKLCTCSGSASSAQLPKGKCSCHRRAECPRDSPGRFSSRRIDLTARLCKPDEPSPTCGDWTRARDPWSSRKACHTFVAQEAVAESVVVAEFAGLYWAPPSSLELHNR